MQKKLKSLKNDIELILIDLMALFRRQRKSALFSFYPAPFLFYT